MKLIAVTLVSAAACLALSGCPSQTVKDGANAASKEPAAPGDINATDAQCRAERRLVETADAATFFTAPATKQAAAFLRGELVYEE